MYRAVVAKYAPLDQRLQQALKDADGKPINHSDNSQGWILRRAVDAVKNAPPAGGIVVNGKAKVVAADNAATNGVVHIIDAVLLPPKSGMTKPTKSIVELAQGTASLSTLVTALSAGNLVTALQGTGPFTVFAPTNAAFAKLPAAELSRLLEPGNVNELVAILTYHVVSGAAVYSTDLKASQNVKTLQGQDLSIAAVSRKQILADIDRAIRTGVPMWCVLHVCGDA